MDDCLGNPSFNTPTSEVVPPISIIIASWTPDKNAAPRMEFVGPDAKVNTGRCLACLALWVTNSYKNFTYKA